MSRAILLAYAEEIRQNKETRIIRRRMRDTSNPIELPDKEFVSKFRLNKDAYRALCLELSPLIKTQRSTAVPVELKILAALAFYAHGAYQRGLGSSSLHNMSQPLFSKCLSDVTNALNTPDILSKYIEFPSTPKKRLHISTKFMKNYGIPGVIGCLDGTHVAIIRPSLNEDHYYNSKAYHSLNVMLICDMNLQIRYVNAAFGGATHKSDVWNNSPIKVHIEELYAQEEKCWLLGDASYPQSDVLMTPISDAADGSPEAHYTKVHNNAHNVMDRCFEVLKARWRCLLGHRVLHYTPTKAAQIVNACVILHNIANSHHALVPTLSKADRQTLLRCQLDRPSDNMDFNHDARNLLVQQIWTEKQQNEKC